LNPLRTLRASPTASANITPGGGLPGKCLGWIGLLVGVICLISLPVLAQSDRGTITGTVTDPAGAVIPAVPVSARNLATGSVFDTVTTATGSFTIPSLPVGRYSVSVTAPGFSTYVQEGIEIQSAMTARIDVALKVGSSAESITVDASAPLLRTENAEQSQTISGDTINQLPLTSSGASLYGARNPLAGLTLAPGTMAIGGTNFTFRVNGSTNTARYLVDGQDITTQGMSSAHLSESHPAVEALQEVTLQVSNFAAEFGQVQGGMVNFTSRSGSNQIHGTGYDYMMNEALNAGRPYTNDGNGHLVRPRMRNNNYGFTAGGPVYLPKLYDGRNRTFFFVNFERFYNRSMMSGALTTVPTMAYRSGDFSKALGRSLGTPSGSDTAVIENMIFDPASDRTNSFGNLVRTPFAGNIIPTSRIDPVAAKIQSYFPNPTNDQNVNNLAILDTMESTTTLPSIKIDQIISNRTKVSFYWGEWINNVPKSSADGIPFPISNSRDFTTHTNTFRLTLDQTVTPTFLIHAGGGELRYHHTDSNPATTSQFDAPGKLGLVGGLTSPTGFPYVTGLASTNQGGYGTSLGFTNGYRDMDDKPTWVASATWIHGNHTLKGGMEWWKDIWTFIRLNSPGTYNFSAAQTALPYLQSTTVSGASIGFPYASFLLGTPNTTSINNRSDPQMRKWAMAGYIQDTWKITRRLTLDYGIRWDRQTGWREIYSRQSSFAPTLANPAAGGLLGATAYEGYGAGRCNCSFTNTYEYAIGPRLGLAFQIDSKTVVRAGWGIVYGQTPPMNYLSTSSQGVGFNTITFSNTNYGQPVSYLKDGLKYDAASLYSASLDPGIRPQAGTINSPSPFLDTTGGKPPRINQWSISLQREIFTNLLVEAAYVGNRSAWIQSGNTMILNGSSAQSLKVRGFDIANPADQAVLNSAWNSPAAQARGIKAPYAGYPTGLTVAQLLRPYPQFGNITAYWSDRGHSWYDSLQMKVTKRYSHNLLVTGAFAWQKELDYGINPTNDVYNIGVNKGISAASQPFNLTIGFTYQVPALAGNRILRSVLRDWTFGGKMQYASGLPILSPSATNNLQTLLFQVPANVYGASFQNGVNAGTSPSGTFMNRLAGVPLYTKDLNSGSVDPNKEFVLNPAAWANPAAGQFGSAAAYYSDYRYQRRPGEQLAIGRLFPIREGMSIEIRAEFFNLLNRIQMADPVATNPLASQTRNSAGVPTSGFGYINSQSPGNASTLDNNFGLGGSPRQGQLVVRFKF
jgi:hypothetical protein